MLLDDQSPIYVDHSILSTFRSCKEKSRLAYIEHLQPKMSATSLTFGGSFHAALETFFRSKMETREEKIHEAKKGFITHARLHGILPIDIDNEEGERRSVERGLSLVEAYFSKWANDPWENVLRPDTQEPYVEMGFALYLMEWRGHPVFYVGKIDRIMRNKVDGRLYNFETKTTTQGLSMFTKQVRPNHQVSGYHLAAKEILKMEIAATIWDCTFISTRQPNVKSKDPWEQLGIDIEKDFARVETRRTRIDLEEFLFDAQEDTRYYLDLRFSPDIKRWPRNAPGACHMYGGCGFAKICETNLNESIIRNYYQIKPWEPWKEIIGEVKSEKEEVK